MNQLIIISGHSCTGKTTLGKHIANKLNLPFYSKDVFKEILFKSMGWSDLVWSQKIGAASMALLYYILEENLQKKQSIIIEANFKPQLAREKIKALIEKYKPETMELHCFANPEILLDRFSERSKSGERHPGHLDSGHIDKARQEFSNPDLSGALKVGGVIEIDTSDFNKIDYEKIIATLIK